MSGAITGIDPTTGLWCRAKVDEDTGRPMVICLADRPSSSDEGDDFPGRDPIVVAVPDTDVQIKRLHLVAREDNSLRNRLLYELVQSVLEDEQSFVYDVHPAGHEGNWFGLIFRRRALERLSLDCGLAGSEVTPPGYLPRSMALGRAYLTFCRQEEGDLICLADLTKGAVSICFVQGGRIVDLASLALRQHEFDSPAGREQLAVDLKTIVSFRLSSLMDRGISTPLSTLVLSGQGIDDNLQRVLQTYFPVGVKSPRLNSGYLTDEIKDTVQDAERFLVALGLTVN